MIASIARIQAVAANTFRETVRERVLYNLVFFAILMMVAGLLLGQLSLRQDEKVLKDLGLAAMDFFGTLIAVFIGVGLVSKEIERRSLYPLLAKPLSRTELLLGKFAGLGFTLFVNVAVMSAGLYAALAVNHRSLEPSLLKAIYPLYLSLNLTVAIALVFSTLTSSALSMVLTICVVLAGRLTDVVRNAQDVSPEMPAWFGKLLYYALPNYRNFDFKGRVVYGDPVSAGDLVWVTAYAAIYISLALSVAVVAFRRRDFQ